MLRIIQEIESSPRDAAADAVERFVAGIRAALDAGMLVRTRTDADLVEGRSGDSSRASAAFASGAQVVSTDFFRPAPEISGDFVVALPGGGVVRCDPVTAPPGCVAPTEPASRGTK